MQMEKAMEDKMMEKDEDKEEEKKWDICCCKYVTAITVISICLWVIGGLIFINIVGMFLNQYFPWWFPTFELFFFFVFVAGLVLITIWLFKDTKTTRTGLRLAAWLIIGSVAAMALFALIFVNAGVDTPYVMIGTGNKDDPDNYDKEPKAWFVLGYIFFGLLIIVLAYFYAWTVEKYKDEKKDGEDDDDDDKSSASKSSKKSKKK